MQTLAFTSAESASRPRGIRLHSDDNVAVVLGDVLPGIIVVFGAMDGSTVVAEQAISQGHKIALHSIATGEAVVKYGVMIGFATEPIAAGAWVHTHNCRSGLDERSHTLDPHSGAPTDIRYE